MADELLRQTRQRRTDAHVARTRSTQTKEAESRSAKRLSIAELNDANADQIPGMLAKARFDNRPTIVKAIDLIDTSRNTMANIAAGKPTVGGVAGTLAETAGIGAGIGAIAGGPPGALVGAGVGAAAAGVLAGAAGLARAFTSEESRKRLAKNEKAAAGQARIDGADILKELGVENRIVRAVGGFAGDMVFDPLTWAGAPGFGSAVRVVTPGARGVSEALFRKGARDAIKGAAKAASAGGTVKNAALRTMIEEGGFTPVRVAEMRAAGRSSKDIGADILNEVYGKLEGGPISRAMERIGADKNVSGGLISRYFHRQDMPDDQILTALRADGKALDTPEDIANALNDYRRTARIGQASRDFYSEFGKGTRSAFKVGLKEGETGSEYLHIPFTDISLVQGPSISRGAKSSATLMHAARGLGPVASMSPEVADMARVVNELVVGASDAERLRTSTAEQMTALRKQADDMEASGQYAKPLRDQSDALRASHRATTEEAIAKMEADATAIAAKVKAMQPKDIGEAVMLGRMRDIAQKAARRARAVIAENDTFEMLGAADNAAKQTIDDANRAMGAIDEMAEMQGRGGLSYLSGDGQNITITSSGRERSRVSDEMRAAFSPDISSQNIQIMDAYARSWSKATGKPADEFYKRFKFEKGGSPESGAMFDLPFPVYHGGPHKFDKFSTSAIGTGEGAQAYGHGLYFTSKKEVAEWYRRSLSSGYLPTFVRGDQRLDGYLDIVREYFRPGRIVPSYGGHDRVVSFNEPTYRDSWSVTVRPVENKNGEWVEKAGRRERTHRTQPGVNEMEKILGADGWNASQPGHTYTAQIAPNEDELLDWNLPFSQQSETVQRAVRKIFPDANLDQADEYGRDYGGEIYESITKLFRSDTDRPDAAAASAALRDAGVRGIKYKGDSSGATNYVIFDDADVSIIAREQRDAANAAARGSYKMLADGQVVIRALIDPNASTLPHETAHAFFDMLKEIDPKLHDAAVAATGGRFGESITIQQHEQFARGFESYLRNGYAPSPMLKQVFERFRSWLVGIYKSIIGTPLEGQMNPQLKAVFDDMLTRGDDLVTADADLTMLHNVSERVRPIIARIKELQPETGFGQESLYDGASLNARTTEGSAELESLRAQLYAETAPLREGPQVDLESARDAIVENERSLLHDNIRRIIEMSDVERATLGDALERRLASMEAAMDLAQALDVPFVSLASSGERALAEFAATELGSNDLTTGAAALGQIASSLRRSFGEKGEVPASIVDSLDRNKRSLFGRRAGEQNLQRRMFDASSGPGAQAAFAEAADGFVRRLNQLGIDHNIPREERAELFSLGLAMAVSRLDKADQAFRASVWTGGTKGKSVSITDYLKDPTKYPDAHENFHVILERSRRNGLLANKKLADEMATVVDDAQPLLKELGQHAIEADLLGVAIDAYMPLVLSKEGRQMLSTMARRKGASSGLNALESFQHARSTEQYAFRAADGSERRFFEWQRGSIGQWTDEQIEAAAGGDAQAAAAFREIRDTVQEFERLPNKPAPMHTDPFELNSLIKGGMFKLLTGRSQDADKFFSTNLAEVIGARAAQQQRAMSRKAFAQYAAESGMQVRVDDLESMRLAKPGTEFALPNGATVKILEPIKGRPAFRVGTSNFRMLNPPANQTKNVMWDFLGAERLGSMAFEENLADMIERVAEQWEPGKLDTMLKAWDKFLGTWRTITLLHPSWMMNDVLGNINLWLANGLPVDRATALLRQAWRMLGSDEGSRKVRMTLKDGRSFGHDLVESALETSAIGANQVNETAAYLLNGDVLSLADMFEKPLRNPAEWPDRIRAWPREALEAVKDPKKLPKKFAEGTMRQVVSPWFRLNHRVNTAMRLAMFGALLEQGNDAQAAARMIRESMYDFSDMTAFESRTLRRLVPFASWVRANIGRQASLLAERPNIAATYPKLFSAVETALNGDGVVPDDQRPQWMRDQLALQVGKDPDNRFAVLLRNVIPTGDAYEVIAPLTGADGVMDFFRYFASNLAPGVRSVGELAAGREFFSGRDIGPDSTQGDISLREYAASQVRPFRELGIGASRKAPLVKAFEQGPGAAATRVLLGGKSQAFDEDRRVSGVLRDFQDRERGLRIAISRAERNGRDSLPHRVQLLALYDRMRAAGLADEVPKWAQEQLSR